ncbi:MAG: TolC family protein [Burkholderia sp.]
MAQPNRFTFGTASPTLGACSKRARRPGRSRRTSALPIFEGGSNIANLDLAHVQKRIEIANYEKAIQTAFREMSDVLAARGTYEQQARRAGAQRAGTAASLRSSDLRLPHNYLTVPTAKMDLYTAQTTLISARLARWTNLVDLYRALGGGWIEHNGDQPRETDALPAAAG